MDKITGGSRVLGTPHSYLKKVYFVFKKGDLFFGNKGGKAPLGKEFSKKISRLFPWLSSETATGQNIVTIEIRAKNAYNFWNYRLSHIT